MIRVPRTWIRIMIPLSCTCCLLFFMLLLHGSKQDDPEPRPPRVITLSPAVLKLLGRRDEEDSVETSTRFGLEKPLGPPPMYEQCKDNWSLDNLRPKYVPDMEDNLWVDDKHGIIFCGPEGELRKRVLYLLANLNENKDQTYEDFEADAKHLAKYELWRLSDYNEQAKEDRLKAYTTVLAVQHPLDRLYQTFQQHKKDLVYKYSLNHKPSFHEARDSEFAELINYLLDKSLDSKVLFEPLYMTCRPCLTSYDVVLRWENLYYDLKDLIHIKDNHNKYHLHGARDFVRKSHLYDPQRTVEDLRMPENSEFYRSLPRKMLDKLHNTYHLDFTLFDYIKLHEEI